MGLYDKMVHGNAIETSNRNLGKTMLVFIDMHTYAPIPIYVPGHIWCVWHMSLVELFAQCPINKRCWSVTKLVILSSMYNVIETLGAAFRTNKEEYMHIRPAPRWVYLLCSFLLRHYSDLLFVSCRDDAMSHDWYWVEIKQTSFSIKMVFLLNSICLNNAV